MKLYPEETATLFWPPCDSVHSTHYVLGTEHWIPTCHKPLSRFYDLAALLSPPSIITLNKIQPNFSKPQKLILILFPTFLIFPFPYPLSSRFTSCPASKEGEIAIRNQEQRHISAPFSSKKSHPISSQKMSDLHFHRNKLAKLGDAISKSETITH